MSMRRIGKLDFIFQRRIFSKILVSLLLAPIIFLLILDYFNLESSLFGFNQYFFFERTWKGRLFYLIAVWLIFIESLFGAKIEEEREVIDWKSCLISIVFALIPLFYVISVNFWGFDKFVYDLGKSLGSSFLEDGWPLAVEYFVFGVCYAISLVVVYRNRTLNVYGIPLTIIFGWGAFYMLDNFYPYQAFKPFQFLTVPTAGFAVSFLYLIGLTPVMNFDPSWDAPVVTLMELDPYGMNPAAVIMWPCAGVHSLFLYSVIMLFFLKDLVMSHVKKFSYFLVGFIGTYFVNVFRIVSWFLVHLYYGGEAAEFFHNNIGELYFFGWMLLYLAIIVLIESGRFRNLIGFIRSKLAR